MGSLARVGRPAAWVAGLLMMMMVLPAFARFRERRQGLKRIESIPASCRESRYGSGDWIRTLPFGGRNRRYVVHVPPGYDRGRRYPVVLFFHGGGGDAVHTRSFPGWEGLADAEGFLVVYPDGTGIMKNRGHSFNAGSCCGYARDHQVDDVGFTAALLDEVERTFCVDKARVYATGFSNGAMMSYRLACELSSRIAAIGPVSGTLGIDNCRPSRPVPVIHFHGTADPYEPYKGGKGRPFPGKFKANVFRSMNDMTQTWRGIIGAPDPPASTVRRGGATGVTWRGRGQSEFTLWTLEGGGHTWPGGGKIPGAFLLGSVNRDVTATQLIWGFFRRHSMGPAA